MKHPFPWRRATSYFAVFAIAALAGLTATAAPRAPQTTAAEPATDERGDQATTAQVAQAAPAEPTTGSSPDPQDDEGDTDPATPATTTPAATVREEIVVSAQADEVPRRRVGSSVTVIDREEIEARRAVSVADLLRTVPGVEVARTGPPGGNTSVFVRGGNSSHTLVLVDGVRVNSPAVGGFDFAGLSTDAVERIEVVRGPQSALYGSEAMGGVISIHTRRGPFAGGVEGGVEGDASAEVGNEDSQRFATSWRGGDGVAGNRHFDWSVAASHRRFDGVSSASEAAGNSEEDAFHGTNASALAGVDFAGGGRAELSVRHLDTDTGLDGFAFGVGPVDDPNYALDREAVYANLRLEKPVTARWTQHLRVGTAREDLAATDPDTPFQAFATDTVVTDAVLRSDLALVGAPADTRPASTRPGPGSTSDTLSVGVGWEERRGDSAGTFDETVEVASAFAENRLAWRDRLFLTTGVRHDDHSLFGGETTWRGTASWLLAALPGAARLHGSYGTGFKAPTFNELYFPGFGNPDLAPETSEGYDLGVELGGDRPGGWAADVTWFHNDYDDLIDFDLATLRAENVTAARVRGVESWLALPTAGDVSTRLAYTWTDSEDRATGEPLSRRPEHRATLTALWRPAGATGSKVSRWDAGLSLVAVADRVDSDGSDMEDYQRLDLTAGYRLTEGLTTWLRVENALDDDAAEINGYTTPGAVFSVGLRYGM